MLQYQCIVEEFKNSVYITKCRILEKVVRLVVRVKIFIMKLKSYTEAYGTLITEEFLVAENYFIQNRQKQFYLCKE